MSLCSGWSCIVYRTLCSVICVNIFYNGNVQNSDEFFYCGNIWTLMNIVFFCCFYIIGHATLNVNKDDNTSDEIFKYVHFIQTYCITDVITMLCERFKYCLWWIADVCSFVLLGTHITTSQYINFFKVAQKTRKQNSR